MKSKSPFSTLEKAGVFLAILLLAGLLAYFLRYISTHSDVYSEAPYSANTPAKGSYATVSTITTGWVKMEGRKSYYPNATIELDTQHSGKGALRVFFKKNVGIGSVDTKTVGDSNTYSISNGTFADGKNTISVTCTKGLEDQAAFFGYRSQDFTRWIVEVLEVNDDGSFTKLAQAPIEPIALSQ